MRLPPVMPSAVPLLIYVATVPALTLACYTGSNHDAARFVQLGALLASAVLYAIEVFVGHESRVPRLNAVTLLVLILALCSIGGSAVPAMAWRETALMVGLWGVTWISSRSTTDTLSWAPLSSLIGSALYAFALAVLMLSPLLSREPAEWTSLSVGYDNYRFFNHVQTVALPLLAIAACRQPLRPYDRRVQGTAQFSMCVYWTFAFVSGARGTVLAIGAALLASAVILGGRRIWPIARHLLVTAALGAIVYVLLFVLLPAAGWLPMGQPADRSLASLGSDSARLQLWQVAWEQITASPWLGVGPMHYAYYPNPKAAHPHNIYLQVAAEWGIPMVLVLSMLALRGLAVLSKTLRTVTNGQTRTEGVGLFVACAAFLADGLVSGNFVMPVCQMWIALCCAWVIAWTRQHRPAQPQAGSPPVAWSWLMVSSLLASQVWLVINVWPEASNLKLHLEHVRRDLVQNAKTNPRFWSDGWF